jgi:hypothetical protein
MKKILRSKISCQTPFKVPSVNSVSNVSGVPAVAGLPAFVGVPAVAGPPPFVWRTWYCLLSYCC